VAPEQAIGVTERGGPHNVSPSQQSLDIMVALKTSVPRCLSSRSVMSLVLLL
jgi:hypothetical protein